MRDDFGEDRSARGQVVRLCLECLHGDCARGLHDDGEIAAIARCKRLREYAIVLLYVNMVTQDGLTVLSGLVPIDRDVIIGDRGCRRAWRVRYSRSNNLIRARLDAEADDVTRLNLELIRGAHYKTASHMWLLNYIFSQNDERINALIIPDRVVKNRLTTVGAASEP